MKTLFSRIVFKRSIPLMAALVALAGLGLQAQTTFPAYPGFVGQDVGSPEFPGSVTLLNTNVGGTTVNNALWVTAGGHDIWDSSDDFFYFYTTKTGGFDARVRVLNLIGANTWAKAELMARSPADPANPAPDGADPHVNNMTTTVAGQNGVMSQWRTVRSGGSGWPGQFTSLNSSQFNPQYPNTWLRLLRTGDLFTFYASHDGTNWTLLDKHDTSANPLGDKVMVGLATTSHDRGSTAYAVYSDLKFVTPPPDIINILPRNGNSYLTPSTNLTFTVNSVSGVNSTGISLVVNGVDQTAALTITGTPNSQNVTYKGPFQANQFYKFVITAKDTGGLVSTASLAWDTLLDTSFTIEGEDFNYDGGKFIDNPVLGSAAGPKNYIDRAGVAYIDVFDPTEGSANHAYRTYDSGSKTGERVGTEPAGDVPRTAFLNAQKVDPAIVDYDVGWVDIGEWWNYTRTFPAGKYNVYARLAYTGSTLGARLDSVTSSATTSNQATAYLGSFAGPGTGNWQVYAFYPLQDYLGNPVVLSLSGLQTLRFTTTRGGLNLNFLMFVPATASGTLAPFVSTVWPLPDATRVDPAVVISATILNRDTSATAAGASLTVNGTDVTAAVKLSSFSLGSLISYAAPSLYALGSTNTVQLVFKDNASPPNWQTNQWSFRVMTSSQAPSFTLPESLALTSAQVDKTKSGFIWDMSQVASVTGWTQNSTRRTLDQIAGLVGANIADPNAQGIALALGTPGAGANDPIRFEIPGVLEVDRNGDNWGRWGQQPGGDQMPGSPGTAGGTDNQAARAVTYIDLPAGVITMGVNSDDGFLTEVGAYDDVFSVVRIPGGEFNGGRGAADTTFSFLVTKPGIYPFVTYWENGGGGSRIAWFTVTNGMQVAINDTSVLGGLAAYRALVAGAQKTRVTSVTPPIGATGVLPNSSVQFQLADGSTPIDQSTVSLKIDGTVVAATITKASGVTTASYTPAAPFGSASTHTATLSYTEGGTVVSRDWKFTLLAYPVQPISAGAVKNAAGAFDVGVSFDRAVDPASATNMANYSIAGGTITKALLLTNTPNYGISVYEYQGVVLTTSGLTPGNKYTVAVNNVIDTKGTKISTNLDFVVSAMAWGAVGADEGGFGSGVVATAPNSFNVYSDGIAEWATYDEATFVYEPISGDFDKKLRVEYQDLSSQWARAGLVAREVLNFGADRNAQGTSAGRYQKVHVNPQGPTLTGPGTAGNNAWETNRRLETGGATTSAGTANNRTPIYPGAWVRMQRIGQKLNMFRSDGGQNWNLLGSTDWSTTSKPLADSIYLGPEFSPENGNINDPTSRGRWLAAIRDYRDTWPVVVPVAKRDYSIGLKFGADEFPNTPNSATLAPTDLAGVPGIKQRNWNNFTGASGTSSTVVADVNGAAQNTAVQVIWNSPNTWSSLGRGETNNMLTGPDQTLMLGYLDTGYPSTTRVTINNLTTNLTAGGYDVYVYIMGGYGSKGGAYRIVDPGTGNKLKDYVFAQIATYPTNFYPVPPNTSTNNYGTGDYIVFSGLTAANIQVESTTDFGYGLTADRGVGAPRAPIAAIQLVSPSAPVAVGPSNIMVKVSKSGSALTISWAPTGGTLQSTPSLSGTPTWTDVGTANPATVTIGANNAFYRVRGP